MEEVTVSDIEQQAGPALDAEVARVVFKLETVISGGFERIRIAGPHVLQAELIPPYSTDVAPAMTVFEAMVEMTGSGSISADMEDARGEGFIVSVWLGFDEDVYGSVGPLPLAICRAALSALEHVPPSEQGQGG